MTPALLVRASSFSFVAAATAAAAVAWICALSVSQAVCTCAAPAVCPWLYRCSPYHQTPATRPRRATRIAIALASISLLPQKGVVVVSDRGIQHANEEEEHPASRGR